MQRTLQFEPSSKERFEKFHKSNPHVYKMLVHYARELKRAGHKKAGLRLLWERLRWDYMVSTTESQPKMCDHYTSFYSRLIQKLEPDLAGFFETRERK